MKKILSILGATMLLVILTLSCKRDEVKIASKDHQKSAAEIKHDLKVEAIIDWTIFKYASDTALAKLKSEVVDLNDKISNSTSTEKVALRAKLATSKRQLEVIEERLKMRNKEFELEVKTFDEAVTNRNKAFQREFEHDMKDVEIAFKDLFKDNVK